MSDKKTIISLEKQILNCKKKLKELAPHIEHDEEKSIEYNKIIVQKAILIDNYKKLCYKPSIKQRVKNIIQTHNPFIKKEKLICDYFLT